MTIFKVGPFTVEVSSYENGEWTEASCECTDYGNQAMAPVDRECKHIRQARMYQYFSDKVTVVDKEMVDVP
ncbi:hypothetical protein HSRCO_1156 [Halanaeroarchaeum sp. HSR-CO]|nr:hypothetical protein HSRCO_1156 [Halanaeroarchaeum sp. HSR-CO]